MNALTMRQFLWFVFPYVGLSVITYSLFPILPMKVSIYLAVCIETVKLVMYIIFAARLVNLSIDTGLRAYKYFTAAACIWIPGQVIQAVTPLTGDTPYIYSNQADIFLLGALLLVIPGVLSIGFYGLRRREKIQILVHAVTFGASVSFAATYFVSTIYLGREAERIQENIGNLFSLSLDIILLSTCMAVALYRSRDKSILFLSLGLFFQVAADMLFLASRFDDTSGSRPLQRMMIAMAIALWSAVAFVKNPIPQYVGNVRSEVVLAVGSYVSVGAVIVCVGFMTPVIDTIPSIVIYSFLFTVAAILVSQIIGFFDNKRLVSAQQKSIVKISKSEEKFQELATHDTLTKLVNRTFFITALKEELEKQNSQQENLAVLFIDLDRFKEINDTYGHSVGDDVIRELASRIYNVTASKGLVCRLGGDEFAVMVTGGVERNDALTLAKEILIATTSPIEICGAESYLSCSIGIAFSNQSDRDSQTILRNADSAMYRAKELGRNRIEFAEDVVKPALEMNGWSLSELHRSIVAKEIKVFYQPIQDLKHNVIVGFEALARWEHPQAGMVPPEQFIAIAEDNGLIIELGNNVISQAITQLRLWGRPDISMNINLSFRQLSDPNLIGFLLDQCQENKISPTQVNFEMTESSLLGDVRNAIATLNEIRRHGFKLHIDDFGTGFSSLSYLKKFPIDGFKIDMSYIQGYDRDEGDTAIVNALVGLGKSMNLVVTAEGVDSVEIRDSLKAMGCTFGQGYLYSQALPADQIDLVQFSQRSERSIKTA